jgi:DNA-binding PadR family transcriptional regulator
VGRDGDADLLLGEWACLGILYQGPTHGFAIAARLKPSGDVGRVWSLSRPLTYRSLDQLVARDLVHAVGEERGIAGGNRTILAGTRRGRARLRTWLTTPVTHLRDMRSELLLKLVLAEQCAVDVSTMLARQRDVIGSISAALAESPDDVVTRWRRESSEAAMRFVDAVRSA